MGIWGRWPPSQGFHSICKWMKPIFWLGCYGCTYIPRNWEFGSALAKLRNFVGGLNPQTPPFGTPLSVNEVRNTHFVFHRGYRFREKWWSPNKKILSKIRYHYVFILCGVWVCNFFDNLKGRTIYSSAPLSASNAFQDLTRLRATAINTESYI
jgi:hypothetical protein